MMKQMNLNNRIKVNSKLEKLKSNQVLTKKQQRMNKWKKVNSVEFKEQTA